MPTRATSLTQNRGHGPMPRTAPLRAHLLSTSLGLQDLMSHGQEEEASDWLVEEGVGFEMGLSSDPTWPLQGCPGLGTGAGFQDK